MSILSRRGFLNTLAAALAGAVSDPERLLWTPGERTIILPPAQGWITGVDWGTGRSQSFIVVSEIINREGLRILQRNLDYTRFVDRKYDSAFLSLPEGATLYIGGRYHGKS